MRRLILAVAFCAVFAFVLHIAPPTAVHGASDSRLDVTAVATVDSGRACSMEFYVNLMQNDLGAIDNTPATVLDSISSEIQFEQMVSTLRHKYEDMDVPATCAVTKTQVIILLANEIDMINLSIAAKTDQANAASYKDKFDVQIQRVSDEKLALDKMLPNLG